MSRQQFCKTVAAIGILTVAAFAADSPFIGTWKLNVAKSKFSPTGPSFKSATVRTEADGAGLKSTVEGIDGAGQPINYVASATLDGKPGTVTGSATMDSVSLKKINDRTVTGTAMKGGKTVYTDRRTVSKDGKTITIKRSGVGPNGKAYHSTIVVEKQ